METLRTTVLGACIAAAALSLAEGILPAERFGKQIRVLTSVLLLTVLLRPLVTLPDLVLSYPSGTSAAGADEFTAQIQELQEGAVADSICTALNNALTEKAVPCRVVNCSLHIADDGSIIINEVLITGNAQTGKVYLREWLGNEIPIREERISDDGTAENDTE